MKNFKQIPDDDVISSLDDLLKLYPEPDENSGQMLKELSQLSVGYQKFIEHSPFVIIATSGIGGLDCTPRGDPAGFVRILDKTHLALPDRKGNNRVDTLKNLIEDPRISLLFMIPGHANTLRVNGTAKITQNHEFCSQFIIQGKLPQSVLIIEIERVYVQCGKALMRSKLWQSPQEISDIPTVGDMMSEIRQDDFDGKAYDANYPSYAKKNMY